MSTPGTGVMQETDPLTTSEYVSVSILSADNRRLVQSGITSNLKKNTLYLANNGNDSVTIFGFSPLTPCSPNIKPISVPCKKADLHPTIQINLSSDMSQQRKVSFDNPEIVKGPASLFNSAMSTFRLMCIGCPLISGGICAGLGVSIATFIANASLPGIITTGTICCFVSSSVNLFSMCLTDLKRHDALPSEYFPVP